MSVCGKCDLILTNRMLVRIIQVEGVAAFKLECLLENATVVNDANGLTVYQKDGTSYKPELKKACDLGNDIGGNISDLGGYYNELRYFVEQLNAKKPLAVAPLDEGVRSLNLILDEIESVGGAQK